MRGYLLALVCVWALVGELAAFSSSELAWRRYKSEHAKVYGPEEDAMRLANFLETKQLVERHNANSNSTFKMRINHMSDWTREERQQLTRSQLIETERLNPNVSLKPELAKRLDGPASDEVDWRKVPNRVSAVKDQGNCSSGWAFATTGLIEGFEIPFKRKELTPLSAQELLDCSHENQGCGGGLPFSALSDIALHFKNVVSESDYPYEAKKGTCRQEKYKRVMRVLGGFTLKDGDETQLMSAVEAIGPVAVSISATENFMHYGSGVLDDPDCTRDSSKVNHSLLVVGYGTDAKEGDYWIAKNSFGTKWGDEGYIKIKRGVNMCAIAELATLPLF